MSEREQLLRHRWPIGVLLRGEDDPTVLTQDLPALTLIAIDFPKFADGRGYSHAYVLRTHLGYEGELRAVGEVLQDQLWHMSRVGFDSFELVEGKSADAALSAFSVYSVRYQASVDQPLPIFRQDTHASV